ncbi:tetratricopeptide repeat protein 8 [Tribolium castaneum]|uniref:Tetratricopeptide repeat protein 8-like Protein n=1 Tax=Tribolium castaneum TaxID=7070 RepID=D6X349_TRICA|nr:PREDICTED: tetratricopeptide repeat protein 8 [Tribolium castaneum]EFA10327.1 Tetratricopeptide repeat protein 8-like Protein [Tribolium castaneum]|eukprot:XP_015839343.1 PREDICTED: tetratricopeptide repeat protein 8 [Tribolium castaneum]
MDPLYLALSLFRRRKFDKCAEVCSEILESQPLDQAAWCLKMRALTQRVYVDDIESEDLYEGDFLDDNAVATAPRPGTSIKTAAPTTSVRPNTSTGRPISGVARPGTQLRPGSALDRLKTARPASQSARAIRLGTAAMYSQKEGPFIQVSRLNIAKYAKNSGLSKPLFEYLFYHEGDVRNAMELAVQATQFCRFEDWWWKVQLGKCYIALNLIRDAEQQMRSALKQHHHVESFIRLTRIYLRLDQPLSAVEICKAGLEIFPNDVSIMTELARLYENLNETAPSVKFYRSVVIEDAMNTEAIACIGMYHFYNNQPEMALRYYRRVLAMGAHSAELYNNLGLCCLYSQQLDLTTSLFQRALDLAIDPLIKAEVWYNLSHLALSAGDLELAVQCLNLCLSSDSTHASAFNNLAVLHHKMGRINLAKAYFTSAAALDPNLYEPKTNLEFLQSV